MNEVSLSNNLLILWVFLIIKFEKSSEFMLVLILKVWPDYSFAGNNTLHSNLSIVKMMFNWLMCIFFTPY